MKRASTVVLVALLSVLAMALAVSPTRDIQAPRGVELAVLGTPDPQAPVSGDEIQAPGHMDGRPHDDREIQAPRIADAA